MDKKAIFVTLVWVVVAIIVFALYLLREVAPVKAFLDWALSVWGLLSAIFGVAMLLSIWIIKHDFGNPKIREQIGEYLEQGRTLSRKASSLPSDSPEIRKTVESDIHKWADTVSDYIKSNLGVAEESLFQETAELTLRYSYTEGDPLGDTKSFLDCKTQRLQELIKRLPNN